MLIESPVTQYSTSQSVSRFSSAQLACLDRTRLPKHVAIIPDGNRRWAKKRLESAQEGHREGADILMDVVKGAQEIGIQTITFYVFSTENWLRSQEEVSALMALFANYLIEQRDDMVANSIKLETIGNLSPLPSFLKEAIFATKAATEGCNRIRLVLALNYGGRDEICRSIQMMLDDYEKQQLKKEDINELTISQYLDTADWEDPELLIRTSGEMRISNYMLWQISYTEIHMTPVLWPDFKPYHLLEAILDYQRRERRWGGS